MIVFPEGTRTPDGEIGEIRKGVSLLGERAGVPLVPALVDGAYQAWPRKYKLPVQFSPISVRFGPPLRLDKTNIETIADAWRKLKKD